jgi:hypothetical protein
VLASVALTSDAAKSLVDRVRGSDECGTVFTFVLDVLIWTDLVSSILSVILGVAALARRSGRLVRTVAGIAFGMVLGGLVLSASPLGTYVCGFFDRVVPR